MLDRRTLLRAFGIGALAVAGGTRVAAADPLSVIPGLPWPPPPPRDPTAAEVISRLPGTGNLLALTIDDGTASQVVAAYAKWCSDTGFRLTFFPNGVYRSWSDNAPALRALLGSGQIQFGNHTWSHPDITKLSHDALVDQITRNENFLRSTFGVTGQPFFRPPYGRHNATTDRIAAELGYPTITLWSGTIGDSRIITAADVVAAARQSFQPQSIVLCHANQPVIPTTFGQLTDLIHSRNLRTVTLTDVYTARNSRS